MSIEDKEMPLRMRLVTLVLGLVFLTSGATKLLGLSTLGDFFVHLRLPPWMLPAVGGAEFIVGLLTLNRSTHWYGAVGVAVMMIGAALTHVMTGYLLPMVFLNAALLAASVWVVVKDRPFFLRVI
ncbi:MAG: DoxX family protein [Archangium sp.]|nr:DoxX family protein [Archangium sp.]